MDLVRVFLVNNYDFVGNQLASLIKNSSGILIAGETKGKYMVGEMVSDIKPDVILISMTCDCMEDVEIISYIMAHWPTPIVVVSDCEDERISLAAIENGALDVIFLKDINGSNFGGFIQRIKNLSSVKVVTHLAGKKRRNNSFVSENADREVEKVVAIVSSTGGPTAIAGILSVLPLDFSFPILIAQHMSDHFFFHFINWLGRVCVLDLKVGVSGEKIQQSTVYVSPSQKHMVVKKYGIIDLVDRCEGDIYFPSGNMLLSSVAKVYGPNSIGIILSGMGTDGMDGIKNIKDSGGFTIAQDEQSSAIYGMPKVAYESGCIDKIASIDGIVELFKNYCK